METLYLFFQLMLILLKKNFHLTVVAEPAKDSANRGTGPGCLFAGAPKNVNDIFII